MAFLCSTFHVFAILLYSAVLMQSAIIKPRVASALLDAQGTVNGSVLFIETENGSIHVKGQLSGLEPGLYALHVHEYGNISSCRFYSTGLHFNPHGANHGGQHHDVRHVGDLGNVKFEDVGEGQAAVANIDFLDTHIAFSGQNNILGRSLVLHEHEDDLGKGGHDLSLITGNSGARIACGVIGIRSGNWNSGISTHSSSALIIFGILLLFLK